jgi:uncharacterized tellurite resistance protein B-like protein
MSNLAKDPSTAGLILGLCIEDIGDSELEDQEFLEGESHAIRDIHTLVATGCKVSPSTSDAVFERAEHLVRGATGQGVVALFSLALFTLRTHWRGSENDARQLVQALMKLVYADGAVTDHEGTMVGMLLHIMDWSPDLIM